MIEWISRVDPKKVFLRSERGEISYGELLAEVSSRRVPEPRSVTPRLDIDSVLDLIAGLAGGGLTVIALGRPEPTPVQERLVVFTSGTTGAPKGVRLTMANLTAAAVSSEQHLSHDDGDDWLLALPLHHVAGLSILVRQLHSGGSVTMLGGFEAEPFSRAMNDRVTMVSLVPTMLSRLVGLGPYTGLRAVLVGGGPIPPGLLEKAVEAGLPVLPTYGMTETFGQVATLRPGSQVRHAAHPLPDVSIRIGDEGRIAVRGPMVSPGYLGEPDRPDPWFTTSDLGLLEEDGALVVTGRADAVIVSGGENVNAERVESTVRAHPEVEDAAVFGVDDEEWGQIVVCAYVGPISETAVTEWAKARMPGFMIPKRWLAVERIPRTPLGKPDIRELVNRL